MKGSRSICGTASIGAGDLPQSVLQYVLRTRERVLLQDASTSNGFADDEYLRRHHARSVLCIPLLKQTRLTGIIYLENNLTSGAFTPARMALLEVLASDAAISLENARLYRDLQEREARVRRLIDANIIGIFHLACRRSDPGCQRRVSPHHRLRPGGPRLGPSCAGPISPRRNGVSSIFACWKS